MSVNHSVSDLAAIIRNGYMVGRRVVSSPVSKLREGILKILKEEGYILNYSRVNQDSGISKFDIHLKYHLSNPVVSEISVISKPGKRVYCTADKIPVVRNGLGMVIISTSSGIVSDHAARNSKIGGEVLLKIF
ncbi:MAG: ribosomal protein [Rickettsiaceae bacterium]|jgi:small subunit ribosomal protein S8|nr:ribosomal protein [Rickettsiaceae bacterium]